MKKSLLAVIIVAIAVISISLSLFFYNRQLTRVTFTEPVEVYYSSTCGCCVRYIGYLSDRGLDVKPITTDYTEGIKNSFNIPISMWSCHTTKIGKYFVEGHVPIEAIKKLLDEQPEIDGIALPDMPNGSPGMSGIKIGSFVIYSISDGKIGEFIRV